MSKKVYVDLSQKDVQDIIIAYEKDIEKLNKQKQVIDKIKEMTKNLFEEEYGGIYKDVGDNCCERFYLLEKLNKLLEEIE